MFFGVSGFSLGFPHQLPKMSCFLFQIQRPFFCWYSFPGQKPATTSNYPQHSPHTSPRNETSTHPRCSGCLHLIWLLPTGPTQRLVFTPFSIFLVVEISVAKLQSFLGLEGSLVEEAGRKGSKKVGTSPLWENVRTICLLLKLFYIVLYIVCRHVTHRMEYICFSMYDTQPRFLTKDLFSSQIGIPSSKNTVNTLEKNNNIFDLHLRLKTKESWQVQPSPRRLGGNWRMWEVFKVRDNCPKMWMMKVNNLEDLGLFLLFLLMG